jgi:hypothetical protein
MMPKEQAESEALPDQDPFSTTRTAIDETKTVSGRSSCMAEETKIKKNLTRSNLPYDTLAPNSEKGWTMEQLQARDPRDNIVRPA